MRHPHQIMILPAAPDVLAAAHRLRGVIQRTPCSYSAPLSARTGAEIYLKWENQQNTGSFKLRGAFNALLTMPNEERRRGVVVSSAGNHGLGSPTQHAPSACARASSFPLRAGR